MNNSSGVADGDFGWLGAIDLWLLTEGRHLRPWEKLGAHPWVCGGVSGTAFAVWAPNARRVAVVGDFNGWDAQCHPMYRHLPSGIWDTFVPGASAGDLYKFDIEDVYGHRNLKADPYAFCSESGPGHASVVMNMPAVAVRPPQPQTPNEPMTVYEVHVGSWQRPYGQCPNWDYLKEKLIPYAVDMGFTHLELLPVSEHPFYGSWGYQPTGLYASSARYGSPDSFRAFVTAAHDAGLKVLLDWVPAHFPSDSHALQRFDGTALFEHIDPREGFHRDWNTLIYNYGRHEVRNFLVGNALYWVERYGVDGLRVDAVASMLYRDYSRPPGEWVPNRDGGRENYEAIELLREFNRALGTEAPGSVTIAEESTAFSGVTAPPWHGGLGFHFKWNMGWMHDTLAYFALDPVYRSYHHDRISFAMMYAYSEHFVLPISHDEVVHGKGSLYNKMSGDSWQKLANVRALYGLMYAHPGKKLLFMGCEWAQTREWNHDVELDWYLLEHPGHEGVRRLVHDLNHRYRETPALYVCDHEPGGFAWIDVHDRWRSIYSFIRYGQPGDLPVAIVCNFTPTPRHDVVLGVPLGGRWYECLNTDSFHYGGSNVGNYGLIETVPVAAHGHEQSLRLNLPPLGVLWLMPENRP